MYPPPDEIRQKGDEICDFMEEMYGPLQASVVYNIFYSLGTGHYVWSPGRYFACWWRIWSEDVDDVKNRIKPLDITHGNVMYVAEAASKVGLGEVVKVMRQHGAGMKGLFWHRPAHHDKVHDFPSQKGAENGITG